MRRTMNGPWARRLLAGTAIAALVAVGGPVGVAAAATPTATSADAGGQSSDNAAAQQAEQRAADQQAASEQASEQRAAAAKVAAQRAAAAAKAAAAQRRAAERRAAAVQRSEISWAGHGRPNQMIIVRPTGIDTVTGGKLTGQAVRAGSTITLTQLDRFVPNGWISIENGVARLSAAVVLTPGITLDIGGDVQTVQLVGGATAPEAASLYSGSGRIAIHGVTVTSVDAATQQPVAPGSGRPFIVVAPNGHLDVADSTISDLGTPATDPESRAGLGYSTGSTGTVVRTTFARNSTGLRLDGSSAVGLDGVTVTDSLGDGLVLRGDQGTTMAGVRAEHNAGNGVVVNGPSSSRPITGLTTQGNGLFGIAVLAQKAPQITGVVTQADAVGGLRLSGVTDAAVTNFSTVDEPTGIYTHLSTTGGVLSQLRIEGGTRGVMMEKTTSGLKLESSTIERSATGVSVGGSHIDLRDIAVGNAGSAVRIERGASAVTATALTLSGGTDGIVVIPGTTSVVLRDIVADGVSNNAVRTASPNAQILGGRITGSSTGIDAEAATIISGTEITEVNVGIRARSADLVAADDVSVSAVTSGINVQDGSVVKLTDSRVDALEAVNGQVELEGLNNLSLPPLNLLGAIGVPLVLLALVLDQIRIFRQRRRGGSDQRRLPPTLNPHTS